MSIVSFQQFTEAFDAVLPYTWMGNSDTYPASSGPTHYGDFVYADFTATSPEQSYKYRVTFRSMGRNGADTKAVLMDLPYWDDIDTVWSVAFVNKSVGRFGSIDTLGGTQVQQQVFATVLAIIKEFITHEKPHVLELSAKEPNRQRLYQRLIDRYLKHIPPYEMIEPHPDQTSIDGELLMGIARKP